MKFYLAGKMSNTPQFSFPAFDKAAQDLRERGYDIVSPAELDDPEVREAALASLDGAPGKMPDGSTWADFLTRDLKIVIDEVDGVIVLDGDWVESKGARLEVFTAHLCGKPIYRYDPTLDPCRIDDDENDSIMFDVWFGALGSLVHGN